MDLFNHKFQRGYTIQYSPKLDETEFGDGYVQVTPKGIHHNLRKISGARVIAKTRQQKEAIKGFLAEKGGFKSFRINIDGEDIIVRCKSWSMVKYFAHTEFTLDLMEVISL